MCIKTIEKVKILDALCSSRVQSHLCIYFYFRTCMSKLDTIDDTYSKNPEKNEYISVEKS